MIENSSKFNFTVAYWFLENVHVKPISTHSGSPRPFSSFLLSKVYVVTCLLATRPPPYWDGIVYLFNTQTWSALKKMTCTENEYDVFVRPDTCNPRARFWFHFSVENVQNEQRVVFNVCNLSRTRCLFQKGWVSYQKKMWFFFSYL